MATYQISLSEPAMSAMDRVQSRLMKAWDDGTGVGHWRPSRSKTLEFLGWVFEQICTDPKFSVADLCKFMPATAPQGRQKSKPSVHQYSVACKMLGDDLQREPTHDEVMKFIRRNPDVGVNFAKARAENEETKSRVLAREPLPDATLKKKAVDGSSE